MVGNEYLDSQSHLDCSQEVAAKIDAAVQTLLNRIYADAVNTLTENRTLLDQISEYLLTKETITGDELMAYINADKTPSEPAEETSRETAEEPIEEAPQETPEETE